MGNILRIFWYSLFGAVFRLFPIKSNRILFSNFKGSGYGNTSRYIAENLISGKYNVEILWLVKKYDDTFPTDVIQVKRGTLAELYYLATSRIWIDNCRKHYSIKKRKQQYYIQTWHGDVGIKHVEKLVKLESNYIRSAIHDSKIANLFVSGCRWGTINYKNAFWYNGEIMEADLHKRIFDTKNFDIVNAEIRKFFSIDHDVKIVLYAPTFRKNNNISCYNIDYKLLIDNLKIKFGGDWIVIVRLHPNITNSSQLSYTDKVINGSNYPQIDNIIVASELLITDYSSCMFDAYRVGKKVILYASDLEHYLENERDMYFDIRNLPAPLATDNNELEEIILNFDEKKYEEDRKKLIDSIGYYDIDGVSAVTERVIKVINGEF